MSSSLRNSVHRRNHKERSQVAHRARLGLLEKHKDYVKRARDFHSKQDRIKRLKEKAAERNKDEFYFGMVKTKTRGGVHIRDRGNASLPIDFVKILKTQDQNYIRVVRQANLKKIDQLKGRLLTSEEPDYFDSDDVGLNDEESELLRGAGVLPPLAVSSKHKSKHLIFVSDEAEAANYKAPTPLDRSSKTTNDASREEETMDLGWNSSATQKNASSSKVEETEDEDSDNSQSEGGETDEVDTRDGRRRILKELAARLKRERNLRYAGRELEMQRLLMGKGASRKIHGATLVEGGSDKEDDDEIDARRGRRQKPEIGMEPRIYRPRVHKWKAERKK